MMVASPEDTERIWFVVEESVKFKEPYVPLSRYLGTHNVFVGSDIVSVLYTHMSEFIESIVRRFEDESGHEVPFYDTPHVENVHPDPEVNGKKGIFEKERR